jgi:RNA polymerase sigma factor (sigma-70 family)
MAGQCVIVESVTRAAPASRDILARMQAIAAGDEELLHRFVNGEASAFEHLYRRHELKVFRYLLRNLRNRSLAEEALQDTWFAVARDAARYQPTARFVTWLFSIAHNRMIDSVRAARTDVELDGAMNEVEQSVAVAGGTTLPTPYAAAVASEQLTALLRALSALPEEQREVFLLQQEGELSVEEIAAVCDCSFETAKSRLRYARSKLREMLQDVL